MKEDALEEIGEEECVPKIFSPVAVYYKIKFFSCQGGRARNFLSVCKMVLGDWGALGADRSVVGSVWVGNGGGGRNGRVTQTDSR